MNLYFKRKYFLEKATSKECFFWNMLGSLSSSVTSIIFSIVVARFCLPVQSDAFSIAYALAAQMWTIANFESGTLMVTDTNNKYSADDYFSFKTVLIIISLLATLSVLVLNFVANRYDFYKTTIVFLFCLYRIAEAFSNYYYSVFQKNEHINVSGFSMFVRTALSAVAFSVTIITTQNLLLAISVLLIVCVMWIVAYEKNNSDIYGKTRLKLKNSKIISIFIECLPLFLCSFLITYLINIPKYSIDSLLSEHAGIQTAYNAIFQPAAIINLFCLFIFRPTLTGLARLYNSGEHKKYITTALKIFFVITAFAAVVLVVVAFVGIPILQIFYGKEYIRNEYVTALICIIIGGTFYAVSQLLYNMITVIRCQYFMIAGYAIALIVSLLVSDKLVTRYAIFGAASVYMLSMVLLSVLFLIIFVIAFKVKQKTTQKH